MEKQYDLAPKDLLRSYVFMVFAKNPFVGLVLLCFIAVIYLNLIIRIAMILGGDYSVELSSLYVIPALLVALIIISMWRAAYKTRVIYGTYRCALLEEGFSNRGPNSNAVMNWRAIKSLYVSRDYYYLMTGTLRGFALPRRMFASPAEEETFISQMQETYEASQQKPLLLQERNLQLPLYLFGILPILFGVLFILSGVCNFLIGFHS